MRTRSVFPRIASTLAIITLALFMASGCSAPEATDDGSPASDPGAPSISEGEMLVNDRCTRCHSLDRVNAADKDRTGWSVTVARMIGNGAMLSETEADIVIDYLTNR